MKHIANKTLSLFLSLLILVTPLSVFNVYAASDFYIEGGILYKYNGTETNVVIPETVNGETVQSIGESAFRNRNDIVSVSLPNSITHISYNAFQNCTNLKEIILGNNLQAIYESAFSDCTNLETIIIPETVTLIGYDAFYNCSSLSSVSLPKNLTRLEAGAFSKCSNLETVELPSNLTQIDERVFYECSSLSNIVFSDKLEKIDYRAFCRTKLSEIVFPANIKDISLAAFGGCANLKKVTFLNEDVFIGESAFDGCANLQEVNYSGSYAKRLELDLHEDNKCLIDAEWQYNWGNSILQEDVGHSISVDDEIGAGLAFSQTINVSNSQIEKKNQYVQGTGKINIDGEVYSLLRFGAIVTNQEVNSKEGLTHAAVNEPTTLDVPAVYLLDSANDSLSFAVRIINIPEKNKETDISFCPYYIYEKDGKEIVVYGEINTTSFQAVWNASSI